MPAAVGVIVIGDPICETGIPLPEAGEAVHVNIYVLVDPVCCAVNVIGLFKHGLLLLTSA